MNSNLCKKCGVELEKDCKFCANCGASVTEEVDQPDNESNWSLWKSIRVFIGIIVIIYGVLMMLLNNFSYWGFIILGIFLMPFVYEKIFDRVDNKIIYNAIQIGLPLIIFFVAGSNAYYIDNTDYNYSQGSSSENSNSSNNSSNSSNSNSNVLSESDKFKLKILTLINLEYAYDTGSYIKGEIALGEYVFVRFSGTGGYYEEEDASGRIVDNENFDSFGYVKVHGVGNITTRGVLISINHLTDLGVSSGKEIYEILNDKEDFNQSGYYKVGLDIEPGYYIIESIGASGYYCINSGPVGNSKIVRNDNFDGKVSVYLSNGQYIEVSRSTIYKQS